MAKNTKKGVKNKGSTESGSTHKKNNGNVPEENAENTIQNHRKNKKSEDDRNHFNATQSSSPQEVIEPTPPAAVKKEEKPSSSSKIQPTSEQLMIARLIGDSGREDPKHREKIQRVMDITNKEEDEVATALYDTMWDESKAIELLFDVNGGDGLGAWEESGKRKKKNKQTVEEKDDWAEDGETGAFNNNNSYQDPSHDKSRQQRGPPRMRRGGSNAGRGGGRGERSAEVPDQDSHQQKSAATRGGQARRSGRGGGRNFPRYGGERPGQTNQGATAAPKESAQAFSGSIDTWNNPTAGGANNGASSGGEQPEHAKRRGGRHNNKDAFDNAGNWGDDFPAAEDWDNEEYTGSLADTKVFTSKKQAGKGSPAVGQNRQQLADGAAPIGGQQQAVVTSQSSSSYSQSIDLSTLLQKPTTQSSITNPQNLLQFQQKATDSLKAAVGLSNSGTSNPPSSSSTSSTSSTSVSQPPKGDHLYEYSSSSATQQTASSYSGLIKNGGNKVQQPKSRLPPPSKIPATAVEMPGESLTKLDVQFGGLDLQFGNGNNNNGTTPDKGFDKYLEKSSSKLDYSSSAPSAKEVTKSLGSNSSMAFSKATSSSSSSSSAPASNYKAETMTNYNYNSYQGKAFSSSANQSYPQYSNQSNNNQYGSQYPHHYSNSSSSSNYPNNYNNYAGSNNHQYQKNAANNYDATSSSSSSSLKYNHDSSSTSNNAMQNSSSTAATLGLTSTTSALSAKISATSASKVNMPNFPPGVANMLPTQYMIGNAQAGLPPFYGLQQHMYSTYNASTPSNIEELAALQRGAAAGLHTLVGSATGGTHLPVVGSTTSSPIAAQPQGPHSASGKVPTTGYYDPNSQFATSLASSGGGGRGAAGDGNGNPSAAAGNSINSFGDKSFGANESTSSPIPSTMASVAAPAAQLAAAQQQQQSFNMNTFAAPQHQAALPPGYAYYFSPGLQAYGSGVYPAAAMNVVPTAAGGGTASNQFQKTGYGSSYASGYDNLNLGQQGNKDFTSTYSSGSGSNKAAVAGAGSSSTAAGKGHQYWNNSTNPLSSQLW